jgi:hypothetical protein
MAVVAGMGNQFANHPAEHPLKSSLLFSSFHFGQYGNDHWNIGASRHPSIAVREIAECGLVLRRKRFICL